MFNLFIYLFGLMGSMDANGAESCVLNKGHMFYLARFSTIVIIEKPALEKYCFLFLMNVTIKKKKPALGMCLHGSSS